MASQASSTNSGLPPDLFDTTTVISLLATVAIVLAAYSTSKLVLSKSTSGTLRFFFIWHLADALCHFILEGSFLYHCFFSYIPTSELAPDHGLFPTPYNFLLHGGDRVYGAQSGGSNPFAQLWMVYARADKRWAGVDLGVVSLELLTVFFDGTLALYICYCIAKRDPKTSIWMIILATCEIYGGSYFNFPGQVDGTRRGGIIIWLTLRCVGFMTFCPEWLVGNLNLDGSNFMYMWVYLVFFNMLWVFIPFYAIYWAVGDISSALSERKIKKNL
uniref:EXPERA domain-containing protein n=1 Tax=Bionectria ochroleuca TaxID=29856 RepID=A0A0B7JW64_BIOOC